MKTSLGWFLSKGFAQVSNYPVASYSRYRDRESQTLTWYAQVAGKDKVPTNVPDLPCSLLIIQNWDTDGFGQEKWVHFMWQLSETERTHLS